jgi:hypothetical protein
MDPPAAKPDDKPIDTTLALLLPHVPPLIALLNVEIPPEQMPNEPVIGDTVLTKIVVVVRHPPGVV